MCRGPVGRRSVWTWAWFRLSYRVLGTCAFAEASPKSKYPRRPSPHLFCQCSSRHLMEVEAGIDDLRPLQKWRGGFWQKAAYINSLWLAALYRDAATTMGTFAEVPIWNLRFARWLNGWIWGLGRNIRLHEEYLLWQNQSSRLGCVKNK